MDFDGLNDVARLSFWGQLAAGGEAIRNWFLAPSQLFLLPTASRTESLWTIASLLGLAITGTNLYLAMRSWRWQRRYASDDDEMREVARARLERALGFATIDLICVAMGVAAITNAVVYPFVLLFGLLSLRLLLPILAWRDLYLYRQIVRLARRKRRAKTRHQAKYQPKSETIND